MKRNISIHKKKSSRTKWKRKTRTMRRMNLAVSSHPTFYLLNITIIITMCKDVLLAQQTDTLVIRLVRHPPYPQEVACCRRIENKQHPTREPQLQQHHFPLFLLPVWSRIRRLERVVVAHTVVVMVKSLRTQVHRPHQEVVRVSLPFTVQHLLLVLELDPVSCPIDRPPV